MPRASRFRVLFLLACGLVCGSCGLSSAPVGPPPAKVGAPVTYVAISLPGSSWSSDEPASWTQTFYEDSLPTWAVEYDLDAPPDWQSEPAALAAQAVAAHPTVVTILLWPYGSSTSLYADALGGLVRGLTGSSGSRAPLVLVGDVVPGPFCGSSGRSALSAVTSALHGTRARVVSLRLRCASGGRFLGTPSAASIARSFASALHRARS